MTHRQENRPRTWTGRLLPVSALAAAVVISAFALSRPLAAQEVPDAKPPGTGADQGPPGSLFGETIDVRVVNVEVVVTDKNGDRVPGLTAKDFRLKVDGKETPVEYFTEVRGGDAVAPEPGAETTVQGLPSLAPGTPVGTSYLVFIDDYFSVVNQRNQVLNKLKDDLGRLAPEDRMAVVAYDGRHLEMLSTWTNSQRDLRRAFDIALGRPSFGLQRVAELRNFETTRRLTGGVGAFADNAPFNNRLDLEELSYAQRLSQQVQSSVTAAASTLRGFASPPGRKVMVLLDGGWPFSAADYAVNAQRPILEKEVPTGDEIFRPLADTANLLGYTVYPVDVPGVDATGPSADEQDPGNPSLQFREQEVHAALDYVALKTGGKALLNGQRAFALETAQTDTRAYYWLGFTPERKRDDARHNIEVTVVRPGLKVRSRSSFLDVSRNGEVSMKVESVMLFGGAPGAEPMPLEISDAKKVGRQEVEVTLSVAIPTTAITTVPVGGKYHAELELRVASVDDRGDRSEVPVVPVAITFNDQPEAGKYVRWDTKLRLRRIKQHLVVAVFDPLTSKILTAETDVNPDPGKKK